MDRLNRAYFIFLAASICIVSGCATTGIFSKNDKPDAYVQALKDTPRQPTPDADDMDPLKRHLLARSHVDPNNLDEKSVLSSAAPGVAAQAALQEEQIAAFTPFAPSAAQTQNKMVEIIAVRVGQHPGKTRLVLDLDAACPFHYVLGDDKKTLILKIAGAGWKSRTGHVSPADALIESYSENNADDAAVLDIRLKKPAHVILAAAYPPMSGHGNRIVMDISPL